MLVVDYESKKKRRGGEETVLYVPVLPLHGDSAEYLVR